MVLVARKRSLSAANLKDLQLSLRALNSEQSAFVSFVFKSSFFESYHLDGASPSVCSVPTKHAVALFRAQRVKGMTLQPDTAEEHLTAFVQSDSGDLHAGLEKQFTAEFSGVNNFQATANRSDLHTTVIAAAKELNKLLSSFSKEMTEVTLIALPEAMHDGQTSKAVQIHSYHDPSKGKGDKAPHTQISVNTAIVFKSYQHTSDEPADVTFNVRDLRVMLVLCTAIGLDVAIHFKGPGEPVLVEPHTPPQESHIKAQLILATLFESHAHRATARRQPGTIGPTGMRTALRTPSIGPNTGDFRAVGTASDRRYTSAKRHSHLRDGFTDVSRHKQTRFAPENQRQPNFETPGVQGNGQTVGWGEEEDMPRTTRRRQRNEMQVTASQAEHLKGTGLSDDEEENLDGRYDSPKSAPKDPRQPTIGVNNRQSGIFGEVDAAEFDLEDDLRPHNSSAAMNRLHIEGEQNDREQNIAAPNMRLEAGNRGDSPEFGSGLWAGPGRRNETVSQSGQESAEAEGADEDQEKSRYDVSNWEVPEDFDDPFAIPPTP